jgi:hypothetical protein
LLGFEISAQPSVIAFKPGKRKRWSLHEGAFTESAISGFCDKVQHATVSSMQQFLKMHNLQRRTTQRVVVPSPPSLPFCLSLIGGHVYA